MTKEKLTTKTLVEIELSFLRKMAKDLGKMKATLNMLHQYEFGLDKIGMDMVKGTLDNVESTKEV
tara:strand:+ start:126 stop:320 length:195 start_codon:yes stop_codon:yes gene_type:complete